MTQSFNYTILEEAISWIDSGQQVALAEFPDIETAKNCYNSEEYVEARKHLENNATREHIIFEGM